MKKISWQILSVLLAFAVAISCMLLPGVFLSADATDSDNTVTYDDGAVTYWDGTTASGLIKTDHVTNASELRYVLTNSTYRGANHTIFFDNDIWVNPITVTTSGDMYDITGETLIMSADGTLSEGYTFDAAYNILDSENNILVRNWAHSVEGFCGIINGNGHTINGLYIYSEASNRGLINKLYSNTNSTFNSLGFENSYVTTTSGNASVLLGDINFANNVTINKCYIGDTVYVDAASKANGFMCNGAANQVLSVSDCYVTANLAGATEDAIGGGVWKTTTVTYSNIYTTSATVNVPGTSSNLIKSATTASNFSALGDAFYTPAAGGLPKLLTFYKGAKVTPVWDGTASAPASGSGSSTDPYIISTPGELYWALVAGPDASRNNKYYKLSCDIVLNDITVDKDGNIKNADGALVTDANAAGITKWNVTSATAFYGTIDGNGYAVKGVYVNGSGGSNGAGLALIPTHNSAGALTISNFGMEDSYIKNSNGRAAALVQFANTGKALNLNQIFIEDSVYVSGTSHASGLVGYGVFGFFNISNCYIKATLSATTKGAVCANGWVSDGDWSTKVFFNSYATTNAGKDVFAGKASNCSVVATPDAVTDDVMAKLGSAFYAVAGDFPMLHVRGTAIGDVDEDGIGAQANDITELRKTLIGTSTKANTDFNRDNTTDVCDLVALAKKK